MRHPGRRGLCRSLNGFRVIEISETGVYKGTVEIDTAIVKGRFEGNLTARERLIVHTTGDVSGKIRYGRLAIDEGGRVHGDLDEISGASKGAHSAGKPDTEKDKDGKDTPGASPLSKRRNKSIWTAVRPGPLPVSEDRPAPADLGAQRRQRLAEAELDFAQVALVTFHGVDQISDFCVQIVEGHGRFLSFACATIAIPKAT